MTGVIPLGKTDMISIKNILPSFLDLFFISSLLDVF